MYKWPLFGSSQKIYKKKHKQTKLKNQPKPVNRVYFLTLLILYPPQNSCAYHWSSLRSVPFRSVLFHCFTSFNVCLNFFIVWTILKFSACSGIGFSITFFNLFLLYFHYEKFSSLYFVLFSLLDRTLQKKKRRKRNKTHTHTLEMRTLLTIPFLMTTNPFLTIRIVYGYIVYARCRLTLRTSISCCTNVRIYMCVRACIRAFMRTHFHTV